MGRVQRDYPLDPIREQSSGHTQRTSSDAQRPTSSLMRATNVQQRPTSKDLRTADVGHRSALAGRVRVASDALQVAFPKANGSTPPFTSSGQPRGGPQPTKPMPPSAVQTARTAALRVPVLMCMLCATGCQERELRSYNEPTKNGQTFLSIDDDNGGGCGPMLVDGRRWPYPIHTPGRISPGRHVVECGGSIEVRVRQGTTLHFDYWGP